MDNFKKTFFTKTKSDHNFCIQLKDAKAVEISTIHNKTRTQNAKNDLRHEMILYGFLILIFSGHAAGEHLRSSYEHGLLSLSSRGPGQVPDALGVGVPAPAKAPTVPASASQVHRSPSLHRDLLSIVHDDGRILRDDIKLRLLVLSSRHLSSTVMRSRSSSNAGCRRPASASDKANRAMEFKLHTLVKLNTNRLEELLVTTPMMSRDGHNVVRIRSQREPGPLAASALQMPVNKTCVQLYCFPCLVIGPGEAPQDESLRPHRLTREEPIRTDSQNRFHNDTDSPCTVTAAGALIPHGIHDVELILKLEAEQAALKLDTGTERKWPGQAIMPTLAVLRGVFALLLAGQHIIPLPGHKRGEIHHKQDYQLSGPVLVRTSVSSQ